VLPGFYQEIDMLFSKFPQAGAAFTGFSHMDEEGRVLLNNKKLLDEPGIIPDWLSEIASSQQVQPPAVVVKREVYEKLGGFYAVHYAEDWEMWVRIAAHYPVAHSPRRLALYRIHNDNITSRYFKAGQSILDIQKVIDLNQQHLPLNRRAELKRAAREHFSRYFARMTDKVYHEYKSPTRAMELAKDSFRMHANSTTVYFIFKIYLKRLIRYKLPD
jgi:hypothetical protein